MVNIFIIGSKGLPARYGGFETFVEQLTSQRKNPNIRYHVACLGKENTEFEHNGARCFQVKVPPIGTARAVVYDLLALRRCISYIKRHRSERSIIYILACRIGPFLHRYARILKNFNVKLYVNPDGHEWKRGKWNRLVRAYWKYSERLMIVNADLIICDSKGIEKYIHQEYSIFKPVTNYIAYGADIPEKVLGDRDRKLLEWQARHGVRARQYYLIVGRFVPENNYELIIREFMASQSSKDLVIISNIEENGYYKHLKKNTGFIIDSRIKFVSPVYDQELLIKIREQAFGYLHGHEVGGTNPSLLEALACTPVNLLLNVVFNQEVGGNGAFYFRKEKGSLARLLTQADMFTREEIAALRERAKRRITEHYSWSSIINRYEEQFLVGEGKVVIQATKNIDGSKKQGVT